MNIFHIQSSGHAPKFFVNVVERTIRLSALWFLCFNYQPAVFDFAAGRAPAVFGSLEEVERSLCTLIINCLSSSSSLLSSSQ